MAAPAQPRFERSIMATISKTTEDAVSPYLLGLRQFGQNPVPKPEATFAAGELDVAVHATDASVMGGVGGGGRGGVALRAAHLVGPFSCKAVKPKPGETVRLTISSAIGQHLVTLRSGAN